MSNAVEELLFAALEKPTPVERSAFLDSICAGTPNSAARSRNF